MRIFAIIAVLTVLAASPLLGADWHESSALYQSDLMSGERISMWGCYVELNGWPEIMKVSDRHTKWGHKVVPPCSFGKMRSAGVTKAQVVEDTMESDFCRKVTYDIGDGKQCIFRFSRLWPAIMMDAEGEGFEAFAETKAAPKYMAYATKEGTGYLKQGDKALDGDELGKSWILLWRGDDSAYEITFVPSFLHAAPNPIDREDFHNYVEPRPADTPWLISFQRRPESIKLSNEGLEVRFAEETGKVCFMPVSGFKWYRGVDTEKWYGDLPTEIREKCERLNRYLKFYPTGMSEKYTVDSAKIRIRSSFELEEIEGDWDNRGIRFAPIRPVVGLALLSDIEKLQVEPDKLTNLHYPTLTGVLTGIEETDSYELTFSNYEDYVNIPEPPERHNEMPGIQAKLEKHLKDMLEAGHLAPYESTQGTLQYSFWGNPAELASTLIDVRRHVGSKLQAKIDDYLKTELEKYPILEYGWVPHDEGMRREPYPVDLEMRDVLLRKRHASGPRIKSLYGLYKYSNQYDDWGWMDERWGEVKRIVHQDDGHIDWQMGYHNGGVHNLNLRIKGLLGYLQLARQKQDKEAADEAMFLLADTLVNRLAFAKLSEYRFCSGQFYIPAKFNLPRFHARNAHKFNIFLPAYKKGANYESAPQVGYVWERNRYLSAIGNFWHDHSIWTFADMTKPLAAFLRDTTAGELNNYIYCVEESIPTWYVTKAENVHAIGEDAYFSPYMSWPIFQAKDMIFREPACVLKEYIDIPYVRGDLYFLQKLTAVLEAR